jgi:polysaccharide biosynthesis/export protein
MRRRRVAGGAGLAVITGLAFALAGCGAARSARAPDQMPVLPGSPTPGEEGGPGRLVGGTPAKRAEGRAATGNASLNRRLLEQSARSSGDLDLPIGPGDLLEISTFEVEELSKLRVRVPIRGPITLPLVGQIEAAGRTTAELEEEIRARLQQRFMHNPQVSVFVQEHNSQRVSVIGAVRRGGVLAVNRPLRLADALAMAEGLAEDADSVVYVIRRVPAGTVAASTGGAPGASPAGPDAVEEVMTTVDLSALAAGQEELNIPLRAGDVVHVPRAGSFYVGGSVERSGTFVMRGKTTLHQAILAAGGVKDVADWGDVRLYRRDPGGQIAVTNYDLQKFEEGTPAPELQRNDVVVVGKHAGKAFFYGFIDFFKGALGVAKGI